MLAAHPCFLSALMVLALLSTFQEAQGAEITFISGKIIRHQGSIGVFGDRGLTVLPEAIQSKLGKYKGMYVEIELTNAPLEVLKSVKVLYRADKELPLEVRVSSPKTTWSFDESVLMSVSIRNRSSSKQDLHLNSSSALFLKDLQFAEYVSSYNLYYENEPFGLKRIYTLLPGHTVQFKIRSSHFIDPGKYSLFFLVAQLHTMYPSNVYPIQIVPPRVKTPQQALKEWLSRNHEQMEEATLRLLSLGDKTGMQFWFKDASTAEHITGCHVGKIFLQEGGEEGESIFVDRIRNTSDPQMALRMVEQLPCSPHRVNIISSLLDDRREYPRGTKHERVCDVVAAWLAGLKHGGLLGHQAEPKTIFSRSGTFNKRDRFIESLKLIFKEDPTLFGL